MLLGMYIIIALAFVRDTLLSFVEPLLTKHQYVYPDQVASGGSLGSVFDYLNPN